MGIFKRHAPDAVDRWIVVGLGNPGEKYEDTRHNAGAMVVHKLAERVGGKLKSHRSGCLVAEGSLAGSRVVIARPTSFMNESGRPVRKLMDFYKAPLERLVVVHDEIDIPFGEIRLKAGGGTAGHNGLRSLVSHLGSNEFLRVRVGVSRPRGRDATVGHVLDRFSGAERKELPDLLERAADAVERIIEVGAERAMNEFNTRP
ncbi:MAG: peptidyl-tRNA hydrolase, family [Actinomycetota bacterium]|nr:peptidyl-tRNA hydrolase, family [Actinomycetota bacterium]